MIVKLCLGLWVNGACASNAKAKPPLKDLMLANCGGARGIGPAETNYAISRDSTFHHLSWSSFIRSFPTGIDFK